MFEAFELFKLVEKLPLKICALATWGNTFILSTTSSKAEAHLLVYQIKEVQDNSDYTRMYEAKLVKTLKKFTAKPVTQLAVITEHNLLLGLAEGEVFYADLERFQILGYLQRSRGAACFAVDWHKLRSHVGYGRELRTCVSVKKRLQIYHFKRGVFELVKGDISLPDNPRSFTFVGNSLLVCIKRDLFQVTLDGECKEVFTIGSRRTEPCLQPLLNGNTLVLQDENQFSYDVNMRPIDKAPLTWSDLPSHVEHVHPYVIGLLPKALEVRALDQKMLIQTLKPQDTLRFIAHDRNTLVASGKEVFKLEPRPYDQQESMFVNGRQFELALQISDLIDEPPDEKNHRRCTVLRKYAFHQFTQLKFQESLENYLKIKEDPEVVIGLYPHLLPSDRRRRVNESQPTRPPTLSGEHLDEGMKHLITYLTQRRSTEKQTFQRFQKGEQKLSEEEVKKLVERLKLIDTTLLKCYIKTGNALLGSLVRLPDNHLDVTESERVLRIEEKFTELVDLFKSKRMHKQALTLLSQFRGGPSDTLKGVWPTIDYLQSLGSEYISLILEYSEWVIKDSPDDALRIFTEDILEVKQLPRDRVLQHLEHCAPSLSIPYLEHIIKRWEDTSPIFHNQLIILFLKHVQRHLPEYKVQIRGRQRARAGEEPGELGVLRTKLLQFLRTSRHYKAAEHISSLPEDDLFEERALLLSRLGRHELALAIYAHVLKDPAMAEEYCQTTYDLNHEESREVYLCLFKMYLSPPNMEDFGIRVPEGSQPEASVDDALRVLMAHHAHIDTTKVMDILPPNTPLKNLQKFLTTILQERTLLRRRTQLLRGLVFSEHLQVAQTRIQLSTPHFEVSDDSICSDCRKRLGNSAFVRYPDGNLSHYFCAKERLQPHTHDQTTDPFTPTESL